MNVLPLFTSAYSFRSILTLDMPKKPKEGEKPKEGGADSIIKICQEEGLKQLFLVEDNMVGFMEAKKNCGTAIQLCFGLRITVCANMTDKTDESRKTESKYVIFAKNPAGYFRLVKIFSKANLEGFFHGPRIDFAALKSFWSEQDLILVVPFYDSFIHKNTTTLSACVPDFSFASPTFFIENNGLFFDNLIEESINAFDAESKYKRQNVKTIYYKNRADFLAWQTYKCIKNESILRKPELNGCMSDAFCVEAWREVK